MILFLEPHSASMIDFISVSLKFYANDSSPLKKYPLTYLKKIKYVCQVGYWRQKGKTEWMNGIQPYEFLA